MSKKAKHSPFNWSLFGSILALGLLLLAIGTQGFENLRKSTQKPVEVGINQLSKEEYEQVKNKLVSLVDQQDPKAALSQLASEMKTDLRVDRSCHPLAHTIGQESFKKYQAFSKAMQYQDEVCASGYLHGVMEGYLASLSEKDVPKALKTVCANVGRGLAGNCYHAVGHGLMYFSANNLPKSLSLCYTLPRGFPQSRCLEGVYMENFNTDRKAHPSKYLKLDDLFYPCDDPRFPSGSTCYFYAPIFYLSLHPENYTGALNWCDTAKGYKYTCSTGLGSRIMKENIDRPDFAQKVCDSNNTLRPSCIAGLVSYYSVNFNSLSKTRQMCKTLEEQNQPSCLAAVWTHTGLIPQ